MQNESRRCNAVEQFLLEVGQTIVELTVEDNRGTEGAVLALVHDSVRILPLRRVESDSHTSSPAEQSWPFPTMPQGLVSLLGGERAQFRFTRIDMDVSELPPGLQSFSLVEFSEEAVRAATGQPEVRVSLTPREASLWGWEMRGAGEVMAE